MKISKQKVYFNKCILILLFSCLILSSCGYSASYRNKSEDKLKAKDFCNKFYSYLNDGQRDSLLRLFKDPGFAEQGLFKIIDTSISRYGEIRSADVKYSETFVTDSASIMKGRYEVVYIVERSSVQTKERFQLLSEGDNLEIVRYDVAPAEDTSKVH